jgi:uncharacterized protein YqjF (DUF2071 family)
MKQLLAFTAHRPFPLPQRPWIMKQVWHDLLFAHWPIAPDDMSLLVPAPLEVDLFDGKAWAGVIPFHMSGIRGRGLPPMPGCRAFPELNVRTYVRYKGILGVYFFSLDAGSIAAVWGARATYSLPYYLARMQVTANEREISYTSSRVRVAAEFQGSYAPVAAIELRRPGSAEHFLTERYCLYTVSRNGEVRRAVIHHLPWPLQNAEADIQCNTMAAAAGITLPQTPPLLHFSKRLEVLVWWPERA